MATFRNDRSGEVINSNLSHEEAYALLAQAYGDKDHWLHFWVHKYATQIAASNKMTATEPDQRGKSAAFLGDIFVVAVGYGLKRPMIRLHFRDQRFKIYLSARGTLCVKSGGLVPHPNMAGKWTADPVGDEQYIGYIAPEGCFRQACNRHRDHNGNWVDGETRPLTATEREFLTRLSASPIEFMAECSRDMGRCCYCNKPLEDERSKAVGYGKTCAAHWGLPWGNGKHAETAPSFAKRYNGTLAAFCLAIKKAPRDEAVWAIFADALEEAGLPRCVMPEKAVTVPRI